MTINDLLKVKNPKNPIATKQMGIVWSNKFVNVGLNTDSQSLHYTNGSVLY